jgi:hypothetical protein
MKPKTQWWIISDEARRIIQIALIAPTHDRNKLNCSNYEIDAGHMGCGSCAGVELRRKALKELSACYHATYDPCEVMDAIKATPLAPLPEDIKGQLLPTESR